MTKFVVLYHAQVTAQDQMQQSEDDGEAEMQAWMTWAQNTGPALIDMGSPLGAAVDISAEATTAATTTVAGYSVIEADSLSEATSLLIGHPHLRVGSITAHEALSVPGM